MNIITQIETVPAIKPALIEEMPLCELCGFTIEELEELIYLRSADLIAQWDLADPRDRWRHTGEQRPRTVEMPRAAAQPYRTPQSTIDSFWYVVALCNPERLTAWLDDHPQDASFLLKLLEGK